MIFTKARKKKGERFMIKPSDLKKGAYKVVFNGKVMYFEFSLSGYQAIQKLAKENNCTIPFKYVLVSANTKVNA